MDIQIFFKEYDRMCRYYRNGDDCGDCPLIKRIEDRRGSCLELCKKYIEKSTDIIGNWAKENPEKTYKSVFLEKFPNAKLCENGYPGICMTYIFGESKKHDDCTYIDCVECWNREAWTEE